MRIPTRFREYMWLVRTIRKYRKITFSELQELWADASMNSGSSLARATFNRHIDAIFDLFGVCIQCDHRNGYTYYIGNEEVLQEASIQNWMLSTMSVSNLVSESLTLQDRILFETVPNNDHLDEILEAMKSKVRIEVTYRRYGNQTPSVRIVEPYCIKLFKQRWYLYARFPSEASGRNSALYAFDRIQELKLTHEKFEVDASFKAKEYFQDSYGVFVMDDCPPERIVLRATQRERYYHRDLPIHPSQKEIEEGPDYSLFELYLRPTPDFISFLVGRGADLKVIEPKHLADEVKQMHMQAIETYK